MYFDFVDFLTLWVYSSTLIVGRHIEMVVHLFMFVLFLTVLLRSYESQEECLE